MENINREKMLKMICFFGKVLKMGDKMLKMACFLGENAENWLDLGGELQKTLFRGKKHWNWVR